MAKLTIRLTAAERAQAQAHAATLGVAPGTKLSTPIWNLIHGERALGFAMNETAAYGISWARTTCRISGDAERAIRALRPYQAIQLATLVARRCAVIGDVPALLNAMDWVAVEG